MATIDGFVRKVKCAETPFYRGLKRLGKAALAFNPPVPPFLFPLLRLLYHTRMVVPEIWRWIWTILYRYPLFRSKYESIGPRFRMERLPSVNGHVRIRIGADVFISGQISVSGGSAFERPELIIGDRVFIGHLANFAIGKRVLIEDDVLIAAGCAFSDYSGHPKDPERRAAGLPLEEDAARPIRICRKAWIGSRCTILPGVTVGEGSIVGTGSIVTRDVPPYQVAAGNPARVVSKEPIVRDSQ